MSAQPFVKPTSEFDRRALGKYELLCRLSTGGMSEIFLATQKGLAGFRKIVVLKSILPDIRGEEEFVKMFLEEARTTAAFNHPNIAQVFDLDTDEGTLFLAMEFVQGATLVEMARACRQAKEPIPLGFTLASVRDTALALHYAHTFTDPRGRKQVVIHRDVAEKNIMVSYDGTTKLLDFGIAKALGRRSGSMTSIGMVKGTSGYMSPEQIRGEPLDPRSDIFALGVVLHECLTGMRLFHGKNAEDGMLAALREDVAPPSRLSPDVTPALDQVTLKSLARDREQRYGTALEFARALEKACPGMLWHAEQSGDLVQRFYNERRQQTRDMVENAQGGHEQTGELKLDKVLAQVGKLQAINRTPTPPIGIPAAPASSPRRITAVTGVVPPHRKPGVPPRATGEKPQVTTDPVGMDVRVTRSPGTPAGSAPHEVTEMVAPAGPVANNGFTYEEEDESGAKTMPATSLPPEMLAQLKANRIKVDAGSTDAHPVAPRTATTDAHQALGRQGQMSNVVLDPVPERWDDSGTENVVPASLTTRENSSLKPAAEAPFNPFSDIMDEPEPGMKTAVADGPARRPSLRQTDTHDDSQSFEGDDPGEEQSTNTGYPRHRTGGIGKFIGLGAALAVLALGGGLYAFKLPPFSKEVLGPQPPTKLKLPGAPTREARPATPPKAEPVVAKADPPPRSAPEEKPVEKAAEPVKPVEPVKPAPKRAEPPPKPVKKSPTPKETAKKPKEEKAPPPPKEEKVAKAPAPEKAAAVMGTVSLVVDPPVHVFFGGKDLGGTPLKASLPVGKQTLKLVPQGGPSKTVTVDVKEAGGAARFDLEDL